MNFRCFTEVRHSITLARVSKYNIKQMLIVKCIYNII